MPKDRNADYRREAAAAAAKHREIVETLDVGNRALYKLLEPVFAGRVTVQAALPPDELKAVYERFVEAPLAPPTGDSAGSVLDKAREHHLLRRVVRAYGLDPGEDLLERLGLDEMRRLFDEEDRRRDSRGGPGGRR